MSHQVFLVASLGAPRDHHAIFVVLDGGDGSGYIFQVTGNIQNGMTYEVKPGQKPEESVDFVSKSYLGWVDATDYDRVNDICRSIPPPAKQFEGSKRLNPREPLRRCQEWTREAAQALEAGGVLHSAAAEPQIRRGL